MKKISFFVVVCGLVLMSYSKKVAAMYKIKQSTVLLYRISYPQSYYNRRSLAPRKQPITLDLIFKVCDKTGLEGLKNVYAKYDVDQQRRFLELVYEYINAKLGDNCEVAKKFKKFADFVDQDSSQQ